MRRRTLLLGGAGVAADLLLRASATRAFARGRAAQAPISPTVRSWSPEAREYVRVLQERQYRRLAEHLKLGDDAAAAYARVAGPPMPREQVAASRLKDKLGAQPFLTQEQWAQFDKNVAAAYDRYASIQAPTPFEDVNRYRSMLMTFDQLQPATSRNPNVTAPLLATLASGEVNARICEEPESRAPIVFFEHGLFQFFHKFSVVMAWVLPPLSVEQLSDDRLLAVTPGKYTMPPQASEFFLGLLTAYVADGTLYYAPAIQPPSHNVLAAMVLLTEMERFAMAHELSHLMLGHLSHPYKDKKGAWEQEFAADAAALAMVTDPDRGTLRSQALGLWASDLALTAMHFLDLTLAVMAFGERRGWTSNTHPDALSRRQRLRDRSTLTNARVSDTSRAAAQELSRMSDALLQRLWEIAAPMLLLLRETRNVRPSPLWRKRIDAIFQA